MAKSSDGAGNEGSSGVWARAVLVVGSAISFAALARLIACYSEKKTGPGSPSSPTRRVPSEETTPDYSTNVADTAHLYHSGQAKLFSEEVRAKSSLTEHGIDRILVHPVPKLSDYLGDLPSYDNNFFRTRTGKSNRKGYCVPIDDTQIVLADLVRTSNEKDGTGFLRAGPRKFIVYRPSEVVSCIVTCGGLCPGMNDVIAELVNMLHYNYSVDTVYGIKMGYRGFYDPKFMPYLKLTPASMEGVATTGGTVLGSSRGGFELESMLSNIIKHNITQVYIIGGDGTHRGASAIFDEVKRRKLKISVIGIPKTIDNDIGIIDRSFGFNTAVEEAVKAIDSVTVEAKCCPDGIGLVKLMGRYAGFIAAHATLANRDVDLCLIPEIPVEIEGPMSILNHIQTAMERNGHCTIVLAEGAGENLFKTSTEKDASGNRVLPDIGNFLKSTMKAHFQKLGTSVSIKYNDPSYMIRSVPANASDSIYCMILAQNAVHGAMAGYTGFTSGLVNNRTVMLPITLVTASSPTFLNPQGHTWERVVRTTHQPYAGVLNTK